MKKALVFLVLAMVVLGSCSKGHKIVGTWTDVEGSTWVFSADGKVTYTDNSDGSVDEYQYSVFDGERGTELTIFEVKYSMYIALGITDQKYTVEYSKDGKTLRLTGGQSLNGWSVAGPGWGTNQLNRLERNNKMKTDKKLNGTWVGEFEEDGEGWEEEITYNNGVFEVIINGIPNSKGTYTTNNGKISTKTTHVLSEDDSGWYGLEEDYSTEDYSIKGKTLTLKGEEGEYKFTKK